MANGLYIYSETAFHHEGDYEYLISLIDESKKAGINAIKFQVILDLSYLTSSKHTSYETLLRFVFTAEQWLDIFDYTIKLGLDIIFLPLDLASFNLIDSMKSKPKYLEIHPVCFYDLGVINKIRESGIPVILGVGGRTNEELIKINHLLGPQLEVLLVGFQSFPSKIEDIKLERIKVLKDLYPSKIIGYADHSSYNDDFAIISNEYAYLLGARVFEKHITKNEGEKRIDYESAISSSKLEDIKKRLEFLHFEVFKYSQSELLKIGEPELSYRNRQKVYVASKMLLVGEKIKDEDIVLKMINKDGGIIDRNDLIGRELSDSILKDDIITVNHLK